MLQIKAIQVDQIIELLLPYCKCHCDGATNFKILSHRHLLVSQLLSLFCCSGYDSSFSVPFLGCFCAIWASFDIWKKLKIELLWCTKLDIECILCSPYISNLHGVWSMLAEGGEKMCSALFIPYKALASVVPCTLMKSFRISLQLFANSNSKR